MMAPIIIANFPYTDYLIPLSVLISAQLLLVLPKFLNKKLPETYEEAKNIVSDSTFCCSY